MNPVTPTGSPQSRDVSEAQRLATAARQLEGVFVEQLFKAMRATVPEDGVMSGGAGEEMFTGLMDQHLSERVPSQWQGGLSDALLRQFRAAAHAGTPSEVLSVAAGAPPVPSLDTP